jgi:hypothetical protein
LETPRRKNEIKKAMVIIDVERGAPLHNSELQQHKVPSTPCAAYLSHEFCTQGKSGPRTVPDSPLAVPLIFYK